MPHDPKLRSRYAPLERSRLLTPRLPAWRASLVVALLTVGFAALVGRALWVQVVQRDFYVHEGEKRHRATMELDATRGPIVDRHGALLALSVTAYDIWAEPKRIDRSARAELGALAKLLQLSEHDIAARLDTGRAYLLLKRQVDGPIAQQVANLGLAGISRVPAAKRHYPEGESVAHVVGFTDIDDVGQEGIELAANAALTGKDGAREVIRDRLGRIVSDFGTRIAARPGESVRLTIDRRVQQLAYAQLEAALARHRAQAGSAVVLDAQTGEILALANAPSFDPNLGSRRSGAALRNRAVTDTFEPGSTIKPLLVALAMDNGTVTAATKIETGRGTYTIGSNTIHDTSSHGTITVFDALAKSSNIALAKISLNLPAQLVWNKYREYGLGRPPALPFPGIAAGSLRPWQRWRPIEQATMAYGYGLSTSLLQVAQTYTAFAGDGTMRPASLVIPDDDTPPATLPRVTTPETAAAIRAMLGAAVEGNGSGRRARVDGYRIGGKTGTAWKHTGNGYTKGKYRALFVGLAPIDAPRIVVAVMIDEPSAGSYYGGVVAAPVFASIASGTLQLLGVAPESAGERT